MDWMWIFNVCALVMMFGMVAHILIGIGQGCHQIKTERKPGGIIGGLIAVAIIASCVIGIFAWFMR